MSKAIRVLAILVLVAYFAWVAAFAISGWLLSRPDQIPADKSVDATPIPVVITSALMGLIPLFSLALGILATVASHQRRQAGWRNTFIILTLLAAPGPILGAGLIVGGLFAGGVLYFILPGLVFEFAPIVMSIVALRHERRFTAPSAPVYAPAA